MDRGELTAQTYMYVPTKVGRASHGRLSPSIIGIRYSVRGLVLRGMNNECAVRHQCECGSSYDDCAADRDPLPTSGQRVLCPVLPGLSAPFVHVEIRVARVLNVGLDVD